MIDRAICNASPGAFPHVWEWHRISGACRCATMLASPMKHWLMRQAAKSCCSLSSLLKAAPSHSTQCCITHCWHSSPAGPLHSVLIRIRLPGSILQSLCNISTALSSSIWQNSLSFASSKPSSLPSCIHSGGHKHAGAMSRVLTTPR